MRCSFFKAAALIPMLLMAVSKVSGQETSFSQLRAYPEVYSGSTVVVRMLDGLGFRYYWATEGLRGEDATFRLSPDTRNVRELMQHIYELSEIMAQVARKTPIDGRKTRNSPEEILELRDQTLQNLMAARELISGAQDLDDYPLVFLSAEGQREYPFWHQINGPIEDAVWHSGQLAMMRRAAGNPMPEGVDFFQGTSKK